MRQLQNLQPCLEAFLQVAASAPLRDSSNFDFVTRASALQARARAPSFFLGHSTLKTHECKGAGNKCLVISLR